MFWRTKVKYTAPEPEKEREPVELFASDDLITRAEKITKIFVRGAIGSYIIDVYRILQCYEKLDREAMQEKDASP